ncbi:DMT family transporter [Candidatus Gracilibacteria bacterium]|nr:DMT family transporter [Candidatus Gracilibacteria bacterium]
MTSHSTGYKLLLGNIVVLTFFYLGSDFVLRNWGLAPEQMMSWGWGAAMVVMTPFFLFRSKTRTTLRGEWKKYWKFLVIISFVTVGAGLLFLYGIDKAGSGPVALLENMQPIFALLLGMMFLSERLNRGEIFSALLIFGGISLISALKGEVTPDAVFALVGSSFLYALHSFLFKQFGKEANTVCFVFLRGWLSAVLLWLLILMVGKVEWVGWEVLFILALINVLGMGVARYFFFQAHKHLPISKLNIFLLLQPVGVLLGTFLIFGDPVSFQKILGAILILSGGFFFARSKKEKNLNLQKIK